MNKKGKTKKKVKEIEEEVEVGKKSGQANHKIIHHFMFV